MIFAFWVERLTSSQHFENCFFKQTVARRPRRRRGRNVSESNQHRLDVNLLLCCRRMFGLFTRRVFSSCGSSTPCSGAVTMDFLSLWSRRHLCTNRSSASAQEECKQDRQRGGVDGREDVSVQTSQNQIVLKPKRHISPQSNFVRAIRVSNRK